MRAQGARSKPSPNAAARVLAAIENGSVFFEVDELEGETDCPSGCVVEPDGECEHGYESAALTLGVI
jgi:hypothetical protein